MHQSRSKIVNFPYHTCIQRLGPASGENSLMTRSAVVTYECDRRLMTDRQTDRTGVAGV